MPCVSSMSFDHFTWLSTGSTERAMTLVSRLSNSGLSFAIDPSPVVQTGVKSFGCENRTPQESPSHSWKLIRPCVVSAVKSGAGSAIRSDMDCVLGEVSAAWVTFVPSSLLYSTSNQRSVVIHFKV